MRRSRVSNRRLSQVMAVGAVVWLVILVLTLGCPLRVTALYALCAAGFAYMAWDARPE